MSAALRRLMWADTDLSDRVRADVIGYMRDNEITQAELARRMGITYGRVSAILHGHQALILSTVDRMAAALDVDLEITLVKRAS